MKKAAFKKLITSVDEAREIHSGKRLSSKVLLKVIQKSKLDESDIEKHAIQLKKAVLRKYKVA